MKIFNAMEPLVAQVLNENWHEINMTCKCEQCKTDVFALSLNMLPARYVTKEHGTAIVKAEFFNQQMLAKILVSIGNATKIVSDNPQCENVKVNRE